MTGQLAARLGDSIGSHSSGKWATIGLIVGVGLGVGLVVLTGGLAAPAVGGALLYAAGAVASVAAVTTLAAGGESLGEAFDRDVAKKIAPCSHVKEGCGRVVIEGEPAARIKDDVDHGMAHMRTGSATVLIANRPAARLGDKASCGGAVVYVSTRRTLIGGPPADSGEETATLASRVHGLGEFLGWLGVRAGVVSVGLLALAVGSFALAGATAAAVAVAAPAVVGFGLFMVGRAAGAWSGRHVDTWFGYDDKRFESFGSTVAGLAATLGTVRMTRLFGYMLPSAPVEGLENPIVVRRNGDLEGVMKEVSGDPNRGAAAARGLGERWGVPVEQGEPIRIGERQLARARAEVDELAAQYPGSSREEINDAIVREKFGNILKSGPRYYVEPSTNVAHVPSDFVVYGPNGERPLDITDPLERGLADMHARATTEELMHSAGYTAEPGRYVPLSPETPRFAEWLNSPEGQAYVNSRFDKETVTQMPSQLHEADAMSLFQRNGGYSQEEIDRYPIRQALQEFQRLHPAVEPGPHQ